MDPVVSVIIATYNHRPFIEKALDSVLTQEVNFSYEVLIGDDCSTDGTAELLQRYASLPNVRLFCRSENMGASYNLNDLQGRAAGKYIAYLDGDDYWQDPHKLQKQVDFLEQNPSFIACTSLSLIIDQSDKPLKKQRVSWIPRKKSFSLKDFKGIYLPGQIGTLLHRSFASQGLDPSVELLHPTIADRALFLLLLSKGRVYQMPSKLCTYRISTEMNSATDSLYRKNCNYVADDYEYTLLLQDYSESHHIPCSFSTHKRHLFVSAFYMRIKCKNAESKMILHKISHDGCPLKYWLYLPFGILQKFYQRTMAA